MISSFSRTYGLYMPYFNHFSRMASTLLIFPYLIGLGPGTLVGSAAFDLFPIHAVCVVVPRAGELKKISDIGVWLVELFWSFWAYIWLYIILEVILNSSLLMLFIDTSLVFTGLTFFCGVLYELDSKRQSIDF